MYHFLIFSPYMSCPQALSCQSTPTSPAVPPSPSVEEPQDTQEAQKASPEEISKLLASMGKGEANTTKKERPAPTPPAPPAPASPSISIPSSAAQMAKDNAVLGYIS